MPRGVYIRTKKYREKLRQGQARRKKKMGFINSPEVREKIRLRFLGNKYGAGNKGKIVSEVTKQKIREANLGKKLSEETKKKMSIIRKKLGTRPPPPKKGKESNFWKGGITPLNNQVRNCFRYRQWRSDIFTRDDFTCQECSVRGGYLHAHHIKEFYRILKENNIKTLEEALNCAELWNINNGITFCKDCHYAT